MMLALRGRLTAGMDAALGIRGRSGIYARGVADDVRLGAGSRDDVVRLAASGDRAAFDTLAGSVTRRLYGIALRILRDPHHAEDLVQDSLVDAWRDLRALRDPALFDAWVTRILVRNCHRHARRARAVGLLTSAVHEPATNPLAELDERDRLERAFRELKQDHRLVLVLRHYLDWEPAEIAENLGLAPGTVRSRLHYALSSLRAALDAQSRSEAVIQPIGERRR